MGKGKRSRRTHEVSNPEAEARKAKADRIAAEAAHRRRIAGYINDLGAAGVRVRQETARRHDIDESPDRKRTRREASRRAIRESRDS